ncbi:MAG: flagellar hook-length control protein FliK [Alphaproteobacteria bacterium]
MAIATALRASVGLDVVRGDDRSDAGAAGATLLRSGMVQSVEGSIRQDIQSGAAVRPAVSALDAQAAADIRSSRPGQDGAPDEGVVVASARSGATVRSAGVMPDDVAKAIVDAQQQPAARPEGRQGGIAAEARPSDGVVPAVQPQLAATMSPPVQTMPVSPDGLAAANTPAEMSRQGTRLDHAAQGMPAPAFAAKADLPAEAQAGGVPVTPGPGMQRPLPTSDERSLAAPPVDLPTPPVENGPQGYAAHRPGGPVDLVLATRAAPVYRQPAAAITDKVSPPSAATPSFDVAQQDSADMIQSSASRPDASPVTVMAAKREPATPASMAKAAVQAGAAGEQPGLGTEPGGTDRFLPAGLVDGAGEGATSGIERFEPTAGPTAHRMPAPSPHLPAGAQIALQITRFVPEGVDRFSVQLHPAELGGVDIQLDFEPTGRLKALITAERPETLELLQRDSRLLERSLGDSGLKLSSDGLSFALKQDHQHQQPGQQFHEQAQARQTAYRAGRAYDDILPAEPAAPTRRVDGLRLLDIET